MKRAGKAIWDWQQRSTIESRLFKCGYCDRDVASDQGYYVEAYEPRIYVCPWCRLPTYFDGREQTPGVAFGEDISNLPDDVARLYGEARDCMTVSAYTAAVMACRKLLMNIAVAKGAKPDQKYAHYVSFLADNHYVPPGGEEWVDHIRDKANEANHEIAMMKREDAEDLITFVGMLLKFIFEFPGKLAAKAPKSSDAGGGEPPELD